MGKWNGKVYRAEIIKHIEAQLEEMKKPNSQYINKEDATEMIVMFIDSCHKKSEELGINSESYWQED